MTNDDHSQGDTINAQGSQGFINEPSGPVSQHFGDIYEADTAHDVRGLQNPYLGLAAFTYAERNRYAGREQQVTEAVTKLTTPGEQRALLFITGASGSGKSSFAQAGLIPALEQHYEQRHQQVRRAVFRPSKHPLAMLADALQQLGMPGGSVDAKTFATVVREHTPADCINVIIIDQFEELFTQSEPVQRDALFRILEHLPPFAELRTHLVATVRADYLPELFQRKALYAQVKDGIELRAMTEDELKQAIQRPLQQHPKAEGKRFEQALLSPSGRVKALAFRRRLQHARRGTMVHWDA
jgi:Cdc6-like AAA superfamily ATPase